MINAYYASREDRIYENFTENASKSKRDFLEEIRNYLLEEYATNFSMFIEDVCDKEQEDEDFWFTALESGQDPRRLVDDIYADHEMGNRQRHSISSYLGNESGNRENPFK